MWTSNIYILIKNINIFCSNIIYFSLVEKLIHKYSIVECELSNRIFKVYNIFSIFITFISDSYPSQPPLKDNPTDVNKFTLPEGA